MSIMSKNFIQIASLAKVNVANLNSWEGVGGNIIPIKKISGYNWESFSYISGQALRRYMKDTLVQLGESISVTQSDGNQLYLSDEKDELVKKWFDEVVKKEIKLKDEEYIEAMSHALLKYPDLDIFGYMYASSSSRRWSPLKTSVMLACKEFKGEVDYLTRKKMDTKGGDIVQCEIESLNFYKNSIMIDLNSIGTNVNEYTYEKKPLLTPEQKNIRVELILNMIKNLNGGSKSARMLTDLSPKFFVGLVQEAWNPFLLDSLSIDDQDNLCIDPILDTLNDRVKDKSTVVIGYVSGIFKNEQDIKNKFESNGFKVSFINSAFQDLLNLIK